MVSLKPDLDNALASVIAYPPDYEFTYDTNTVRSEPNHPGIIEVRNESTTNACYRLVVKEGKTDVCALNFANPFFPGGGFAHFATAQEETLCRSSALYYTLIQQMEFYDYHKDFCGSDASNYIIFSPNVPTWKINQYTILDRPFNVSYITCAACDNRRGKVNAKILNYSRISAIIKCCIEKGVKHAVFGAWGCGVFANDPIAVAQSFKKFLVDLNLKAYFDSITFSICGSPKQNLTAFADTFECKIIK